MIRRVACLPLALALSTDVALAQEVVGEPGSSTAILEQVVPSKRHLQLQYFNWSYVKDSDLADATGPAIGYNWVQAAYEISDGTAVGVRQQFEFNYRMLHQPAKPFRDDLGIGLTSFKTKPLPGNIQLSGTALYYFPTAEDAANSQRQGIIYTEFDFLRDLNSRWALIGMLRSYYQINSRAAQISETVDDHGSTQREITGNLQRHLYSEFAINYNIVPEKWVFTQAFYLDQYWYNPVPESGVAERTRHAYQLDSSINWTPNSQFALSLGINDEHGIWPTQSTFYPLSAAETTYYSSVTVNY